MRFRLLCPLQFSKQIVQEVALSLQYTLSYRLLLFRERSLWCNFFEKSSLLYPSHQISDDNDINLPSDRCSVPKGSTETLADLAILRLTTPSDNSPLSSRAVFREHYMYG